MNLTRLRAGVLALALPLMLLPGLALAQNAPLYQTGAMTPRHIARFATNGLVMDSGYNGVLGDAQGRGVGPYAVDDAGAPGTCWDDAPTISSTGYDALCLGHDASGNALLTVDSYSKSAGTLKYRINGTTYNWPGPGGGDMIGPLSSTDGNVPVFNGTGGTLLKDQDGTTATRLTSRLGSFAAAPHYVGGTASAAYAAELGSAGVPNSTADAVVIGQKFTNYAGADGGTNAAGYFTTWKYGNASSSRGTALAGETVDHDGWSNGAGVNAFAEGVSGQCWSAATAALSSCYGGVFYATRQTGATSLYEIGVEGGVDGNAFAATDTNFINPGAVVAFNATVGFSAGSGVIHAAYLINPFSAGQALFGLFVPPNLGPQGLTVPLVKEAAVRVDGPTQWAVDASRAGAGNADMVLANTSYYGAVTAGGVPRALLSLDTTNHALLGADPALTAVLLASASVPTQITGPLVFGGLTGPSITIGAGVPGTTEPIGSIFIRSDGTTGSTLYVSHGSGVWNPIAGV